MNVKQSRFSGMMFTVGRLVRIKISRVNHLFCPTDVNNGMFGLINCIDITLQLQ